MTWANQQTEGFLAAQRKRRTYTETHKWCPRCSRWLEHSCFRRNAAKDSVRPKNPSGLQVYCKPCENEYRRARVETPETREKRRAWHAEHRRKPEVKERERETRFLRKYGLTLSDYEERYEAQLGKCLICETGFPMFGLHVDHDHDSGVVRGLLCGPCNRALGWYERTKSDYEKYEAYLGRSAT